MNVGYHFHVPVVIDARGVGRYPAHFGVFVEELARQAGTVTFFAFEGGGDETYDLELDPGLVGLVNLGPRRPGPLTRYLSGRAVARMREAWTNVDVLLVRAPGPLVPTVVRLREGPPKVALMMGDLQSWRPNRANARWRNALIGLYLNAYIRDEMRALRTSDVLVNNRWLRERLEGAGCSNVSEVFTSTLTDEMVRSASLRPAPFERDLEASRVVRLLYTGRLVEEKGILDLVDAVIDLRETGVRVELELVGWAPNGDPTVDHALRIARRSGMEDAVRVTGYVPLGPQLFGRYASSDVYLFASPTEWGMPQSMIEAMAAGLPVVTTDFEGRRGLLEDGVHALIVPPRSPRALGQAVRRLVVDPDARRRIGRAGREWAHGRTNERSVRQIVGRLHAVVDRAVRR